MALKTRRPVDQPKRKAPRKTVDPRKERKSKLIRKALIFGHLLILLILLILLVPLVYFLVASVKPTFGKTRLIRYQETLARYETEIPRLDELLVKIDQEVANLEREIEIKASVLELGPEEVKVLLSPIELYKRNKGNNLRNDYALRKQDLRRVGPSGLDRTQFVPIQEVSYFFFAFKDEKEIGAAGYNNENKVVLLKRSFDPYTMLDMLVLYHELVHVLQDISIREKLATPELANRYLNFYSGSEKRTIGSQEHEAYFLELKLLDLHSEGRLSQQAREGEIEQEYFKQLLKPTDSQKELVGSLTTLALEAFREESANGRFPTGYVSYINDIYRKAGVVIYEFDESGKAYKLEK